MPRPEPPPSTRLTLFGRFVRIMRWLALLAIAVAALAVAIVARGDSGFHIHMLIATALGVGLMVLLGTGLMTLAFLSAKTGHDAEAGQAHEKEQQ